MIDDRTALPGRTARLRERSSPVAHDGLGTVLTALYILALIGICACGIGIALLVLRLVRHAA